MQQIDLTSYEIYAYQEIVKHEIELLIRRHREIDPIVESDIKNIIRRAIAEYLNLDLQKASDLAERTFTKFTYGKWLVRYDDSSYLTRHGVLMRNIVRLRWVSVRQDTESVYIPSIRQVVDFDMEEPREVWLEDPEIPLEESQGLRALLSALGLSEHDVEKCVKILQEVFNYAWHSGVKAKITRFQDEFLKRLAEVHRDGTVKALVVSAPTGIGKTKLIEIAVLAHVLAGKPVILCFPRKSLVRQELEALLRAVYYANSLSVLDRKIAIVVDDGSTKREDKVRSGEPFRNLRCPICGAHMLCHSVAKVREGRRVDIVCENRTCSFNKVLTPYLHATRGRIRRFSLEDVKRIPYIYLTNVYCLERRLLEPDYWPLLESAGLVILDEAHVYTGYLGGHVHFVLRKLQWRNPRCKFVLSSATLSSPRRFGAELLGVDESQARLLDYREHENLLISSSTRSGLRRRLLIYMYVLPHPEVSVDTVVENLTVLLRLWCQTFNYQAIVFIDNIRTINRLEGYIKEVICGRRKLGEVFALLNYNLIDRQIVPEYIQDVEVDSSRLEHFVEDFKQGIDVSHSRIRNKDAIEEQFRQGTKRVLLSTSTMELGLNIDYVAAILQHSFPITPEAFIQRVGRAGRTDKTAYVSLGIMVLPHSTLGVRFVHDREFRKKLQEEYMQRIDRGYAVTFQHILTSSIMLLLEEKVIS